MKGIGFKGKTGLPHDFLTSNSFGDLIKFLYDVLCFD